MATVNQIGLGLRNATGTGSFAGSTSASISSPTFTTPALGIPSSGNLINCTNMGWGTQGSALIPLSFASGTLSASQIKSLSATPVNAIGAPGSNRIIIVAEIAWQYVYVSPVYTAAGGEFIRCRFLSGGLIYSNMIDNSILTTAQNSVGCGPQATIGSSAGSINSAVTFTNPQPTEVTNGNSYINWWISYFNIDLTAF